MSADRLYFEDLEVGSSIELGNYRVTKEEILEFARKYDPQPFHVDEKEAEESMFKGLVASGWHTSAICMRLYVDAILNRSASMGSPGVDKLRWKRPVRPGDTLHGQFSILEKNDFREGIGRIKGKAQLFNQNDKLVLMFIGEGLFAKKE